jgi:hypothetical protein
MWEDLGNLLFVTAFFVALPLAVDVVVLWRLIHGRTNSSQKPFRTVVAYVGLTTNFSAIAIAWGTFYCNLWLSEHHSGTVVGGARSYEVALILALLSLIFGFLAPKCIRPLLAIAGLYVFVTMIIVSGGGGVL